MPTYCRLDLSTKYEWQKSWGSIEPYCEVINVLNRKNVGYRSYTLAEHSGTYNLFAELYCLEEFSTAL
ncbi:MAG: hypothetical protein PHQ78_05595 [Candidatus Cloacimonetes bacterium]|nr:hypothetical protein [Candidatus Cloacimonadota bacterium]MDD2506772.1 hypothetical protein [Candidatus Cloacimonadota bacterium]MDD4560252.1 hypothetical protein [Candidatus Cloacimonadota bacterium]